MAATFGGSRAAIMALGAAAIVLIAAIGYSLSRGRAPLSPAVPKTVVAARALPQTIDALAARVRTTPGDADAWAALGNAQFGEGRFAEAETALAKGVALAPGRADIWSALGEARVMASAHDPMPAPALAAFRKALAIDPKDPRSRYFAAVARDLGGDHRGAIEDWFALLGDTPPGAPWENDLRRTIAQVGKINRLDVAARLAASEGRGAHPSLTATAAIPGPNGDEMRAAAALPPGQQDAMVQQMVARLESRLESSPRDVDGWVMLMRSRKTLGDDAAAGRALADATAANPAARDRLLGEAAALGIPAR